VCYTNSNSAGAAEGVREPVPRPFGTMNSKFSLYGSVTVGSGVAGSTFAEPFADFLLALEMNDLDTAETLRVPLSNALSWRKFGATSASMVTKPDGSDLLAEGFGTGTDTSNVFIRATMGSENEVTLAQTGAGLFTYLSYVSTNLYCSNFLVRTQIENAVSANTDISYNVLGGTTNITFYDTVAPTTPITTWTHARVVAQAIFATVTDGSDSFRVEFTIEDTRLTLTSPTVDKTFAVNGGYCRVTPQAAEALSDKAAKDGTDVGTVAVGSTDADTVLISAASQIAGVSALDADTAGAMTIRSFDGQTMSLRTLGAGAKLEYIPEGDAASYAKISTSNKTTAQYNLDIIAAADDGAIVPKSYVDGVVASATLAGLTDTTITSGTDGDRLHYFSGQWVNRAPVDGQIKANSFDTDGPTLGALLTYTSLTTEVDVVYRIPAETTTALNISSFPTTSVPLNYGGVFQQLGTVGVDGDFYRLGVAASGADDRWIQNGVLGQISEYRIEGGYSNKTSSNSGRIQIRIYNPLSAFSFEATVPLAQGTTNDQFGVSLITISDGANLLPPAGTGAGYKIGISSTVSLDATINSIVRIDRPYSPRS
jgi:hypothetical protein